MDNLSKENIVFCHRMHKRGENINSRLVNTTKAVPKCRIFYYNPNSKFEQKRDLSLANRKNTNFDNSFSTIKGDKIFNTRLFNEQKKRTKFYLNRIILRRSNIGNNAKTSSSLFKKLQEMYSVHNGPAENVPRLRTIEQQFPKLTEQQSLSYVEKTIVDNSWNIDLPDIPKLSNNKRTVSKQMDFMSGLKKTEEDLNNRLSNFKNKLNVLSRETNTSNPDKAQLPSISKQLVLSSTKLRSNSFIRKKSYNALILCKKDEDIKSTKVTLNMSLNKLHYSPNGPAEKFMKLLLKGNPLFYILHWTLQCPFNLLSKEHILKYLCYCISEQARPVMIHSNEAMSALNLDYEKLNERQARVIVKMLKYFPQTITQVIINIPKLSDNVLKELLMIIESSKAIYALTIKKAEVEFNSLNMLRVILKQELLTELALSEVVFDNFQCLMEDTALLLKLEKLKLSKFKCNNVAIDYLLKLIKASKNLFSLNISKFTLTIPQLLRLIKGLIGNKRIEYLNLSHQALTQQTFETHEAVSKVELKDGLYQQLTLLIPKSPCLTCLNISYTSLTETELTKIVYLALESETLLSIHLTGNNFTKNWINTLCKEIGGIDIRTQEATCVLWRNKSIDMVYLKDTWIISDECFLCKLWRVTAFICNTFKKRNPPKELMCSVYGTIKIPLIKKEAYESICGIIESSTNMKVAYNIPRENTLKEPLYFAVLLLPPYISINYSITFTSGDVIENEIRVTGRAEDIHSSLYYKMKDIKRKFIKAESLFKDWRIDTEEDLWRMIEIDYEKTKLDKLINSLSESQKVLNIFYDYSHKIKDLFIHLAAKSSYPYISRYCFNAYLKKKAVLGNTCTLSDVDRYFITINLHSDKDSNLIDDCFPRYQLLEILLRIANRKYRESNVAKTYAGALKMFLNELFREEKFEIRKFREEKVWCLPVDDLLRGNLPELKHIFKVNSEGEKYITMKSAINLIKQGVDVSEYNIIEAYCQSKMTVIDEAKQGNEYKQMVFEEFLEFIVRIADIAFTLKNLLIEDKVNKLLILLFPKYKLNKKAAYLPDND